MYMLICYFSFGENLISHQPEPTKIYLKKFKFYILRKIFSSDDGKRKISPKMKKHLKNE